MPVDTSDYAAGTTYTELEVDIPTPEEERELILRCEAGDEDAQHELAVRNMPLVFHYAKRFNSNGNYELHDMYSEGYLALLHAARKVRSDAGTRFSTYATTWVLCYLRQMPYMNATYRPGPRSVCAKRQNDDGTHPLDGSPHMGVWSQICGGRWSSVMPDTDRTVQGESVPTGEDPADIVCTREQIEELETLISRYLSDRERDAVLRRMQGDTFREISADHGVSKQTVRNWYDAAITKLQDGYRIPYWARVRLVTRCGQHRKGDKPGQYGKDYAREVIARR